MTKTRILLADDHPMIQAAVETLLRGSPYELVGKALSGAQALKAIAACDPDIVVLDVHMPEGTGLDVLRKLRADGDARKVVLLTASLNERGFLESLKLKVDGVVLKSSDPGLLLDCLDHVREGESWIDPQLRERPLPASEQPVSLTPRERDLVALVREGLRNRDIAARLGVTEGTVKVYLHAIFDKVGVVNRTELAIRAADLLQ